MSNLNMTSRSTSVEADAVAALFDDGYLNLYDDGSTGQPASADDPVTDQVLLASMRFGSPAFGPAVAGVITSHAITSDPDAAATGNATWFRVFQADGATAVMDGSVGDSDADMVINSTAIQVHARVDCASFVHTVPR